MTAQNLYFQTSLDSVSTSTAGGKESTEDWECTITKPVYKKKLPYGGDSVHVWAGISSGNRTGWSLVHFWKQDNA